VARLRSLGVLEVAERGAGGGDGPGSSVDTEGLERGDAKVSAEEGSGPGGVEVRRLALGDRKHAQDVPDGGAHRGGSVRGDEDLAGLVRGDRLQEGRERRALERAEVTGGDVEEGGPVSTVARAHRDQPGGAGGVEHFLVQHGARGDDADDLPADDARAGAGGFDLLADGDLVAGVE